MVESPAQAYRPPPELQDRHPLCRFTSFDIHQVEDRIRRHLRIQPFINLVYPKQQFNVDIEVIGSFQKSIISEDETFGFEISTEKQAYLNHLSISPGDNIDVINKVANIYVPIPWATYIDKKQFGDIYLNKLKKAIAALNEISIEAGFVLKVHSVCHGE